MKIGKAKAKAPKTVTVIGVESKKSKMVDGQEYEVSPNVAEILIKAKRAKKK